MKYEEIMEQLKSLGTSQNVKKYIRHGAGPDLFGVSFGNLNKIAKKLKINHEVGLQLWESGNMDAQLLATRIMDPQLISREMIEKWIKEISYYVLLDDFVFKVVVKTPFAQELMLIWIESTKEWIGRAGWNILNNYALYHKDLPDSFFEPYLSKLEAQLQTSKNRTKQAMNNTLIAIGIKSAELAEKAITVARKIGKVTVNHGKTACKTPIAEDYIIKSRKRLH